MNTLFSLSGRRVVVTGSASGIGAAIALTYAQAGADLVLADLDGGRLETIAQRCRAFGVMALPVQADVSDEGDAERIVDCCIESFGGIDILVNNAGMLTQGRCVDLTTRAWDDMLRVNLRSVFLCTRRALPSMLARKWGRVINISSQLGIKGGVELSHYAAAKAGVIGFTKSLALEVASENVLINAIAPGPIETPLIDGMSAAWRAAKSAHLPLGRFGTPSEVAPAALLLASDPGGNLFVGQTLGPNSGDVMP
ncbi:SDR family NAD(P)-dependent oxidoreductase [Burkholderia alba]|uniref:SDR family NAD(P)-dependent oxidoreductase n=1 Tax=Burkholderia alba TaxID=2683677 RepID=UPI002B0528AE|nr:SDR family NAD(P)-dependent oxidoreductase [Burkholderia alba]